MHLLRANHGGFSNAPFKKKSGPAGPALPVTAGLLSWLDASDSSVEFDGSGLLTKWTDKAAARIWTPGGTTPPRKDTTRFGQQAVLIADRNVTGQNGTSWLNASAPVAYTDQITVYMVIYMAASGAARAMGFYRNSNSNALNGGTGMPWVGVFSSGSGNVISRNHRPTGTIWDYTGVAENNRVLMTVTSGSVAGDNSLRLDGSANAVNNVGSGGTGAAEFNILGAGDTYYVAHGVIAETLVYSGKHTAQQILDMEAYLAPKWGTASA